MGEIRHEGIRVTVPEFGSEFGGDDGDIEDAGFVEDLVECSGHRRPVVIGAAALTVEQHDTDGIRGLPVRGIEGCGQQQQTDAKSEHR